MQFLALALSLVATPNQPALKILQTNCIRCHNEEKMRGGLDLSTRDAALQGGATSDALIPGEPEKSALFTRAREGSMPPEKDGRRLTKEEVSTIEKWILGGAKWEK